MAQNNKDLQISVNIEMKNFPVAVKKITRFRGLSGRERENSFARWRRHALWLGFAIHNWLVYLKVEYDLCT